MYRWVYILATTEEAKKYQFCGQMKNKKGEKISYTGRVRTLDENKLEILKEADINNILEGFFEKGYLPRIL